LSGGGDGVGVVFEDVSAEIPHGEGSDECAPDEAWAAAETLDEPDAEDDHAEGFGDAVEAEMRWRVRFVDGWRGE
jgi:hypothetical protein